MFPFYHSIVLSILQPFPSIIQPFLCTFLSSFNLFFLHFYLSTLQPFLFILQPLLSIVQPVHLSTFLFTLQPVLFILGPIPCIFQAFPSVKGRLKKKLRAKDGSSCSGSPKKELEIECRTGKRNPRQASGAREAM